MFKNKSIIFIIIFVVIVIGGVMYYKKIQSDKQKIKKTQMLRKRLMQLGLIAGAGGLVYSLNQSKQNNNYCQNIDNINDCNFTYGCIFNNENNTCQQISSNLSINDDYCNNLSEDQCKTGFGSVGQYCRIIDGICQHNCKGKTKENDCNRAEYCVFNENKCDPKDRICNILSLDKNKCNMASGCTFNTTTGICEDDSNNDGETTET